MYLAGAAFTVALSIILIILDRLHFGQNRNPAQLLKITVPEDLNYKDAFKDVLEANTDQYALKRVKTTDLGSLFEVNYQVVISEGIDEKSFLDDLRCKNGNLSIVLTMAPAE